MGFFKDLKGDALQPLEDAGNKAKDTEESLDKDKDKEMEDTHEEDFLDEDMYKDILAAAEVLLSDGLEDSLEEDSHGGSRDDGMDGTNKDKGVVEDTMVDFDENVADEEILDTLLAEEEKVEVMKDERAETQKHTSELTVEEKEAVTVITKGTTINGSIISDCSLEVMGTINGDIECLGKLSISGRISGNSMASEVYVKTDRVEGSINSEGSVKIGQGTVVIGDITATSGVIAGAVKGEIDITGPIVIDSTAIIKGNIKAKSVQMNNGAVLEGFCSLSYASVDINNIFE